MWAAKNLLSTLSCHVIQLTWCCNKDQPNLQQTLQIYEKALKQLQYPFVPWTRPFLHCSRPFCTRRKTPWTNFNTLLYTAQSPLNQLQGIFVHVQNRHANVQSPFVACAKPLEVTSKAFCTWYKTAMQTFKPLLFILQNSDATIQSRIVPTAKTYGYFGRIPFHFYL